MKNNSKLLDYELLERESTKLNLLSQKEDLSLYQLRKIIKTLKLIEIRKHELNNEYNIDYFTEKRLNVIRRLTILQPSIIMLTLISKYVIFSLIILIIQLTLLGYSIKNFNSIRKEEKEAIDKIPRLISNIEENLRNIKLNVSKKTREINSRKNNTKIYDIDLANNIILDMLNDNKIDYEINNKIKDLIIKILQDDLNSKEDDIYILINEAKRKNSVSHIGRQLGLKRIVSESELL